MSRTHHSYATLWVLTCATTWRAVLASTSQVNNTVDDQESDGLTGLMLNYAPDITWNLGTECANCSPVSSIIDASRVFNGTWHDATVQPAFQSPVLTATFTGVAVYMYNVVANTIPSITTITSMTFTIDGQAAGSYTHSPDTSSSAVDYNVLVFSTTGLPNTIHTLQVGADNDFNSLIIFDRIVYTAEKRDDGSTSSSVTETPSTSHTSESSTSTMSTVSLNTSNPTLSGSTAPHPTLPLTSSASTSMPLPSVGSSDTAHGDATAHSTVPLVSTSGSLPALPTPSEEPNHAPSRQPHLPTIMGAVAGCIVATLMGIAFVVYCRRRRLVHGLVHQRSSRRARTGTAGLMSSTSTPGFQPLRFSNRVSMSDPASTSLTFASVRTSQLSTHPSGLSFTGAARSPTISPLESDAIREACTPPPPYCPDYPRAALSEDLGGIAHVTRHRTCSGHSQHSWSASGGDPFRTPPLSRTNSSRYSGSLPPSYHSELGPPSYISTPSPT